MATKAASPAGSPDGVLRPTFDPLVTPLDAPVTDGARCVDCGAVYTAGRWRWQEPTSGDLARCEACWRIAEHHPAGEIYLYGDFVSHHRDELLRLIRNEAAVESLRHPLNRIMDVRDTDEAVVVTTTDIDLPRRVAKALQRTHQGVVHVDYHDGGRFVRLRWHRG